MRLVRFGGTSRRIPRHRNANISLVVVRPHRNVRMALGARHLDVLWLIVGRGPVVTASGTALGVAIAVMLTRLLKSMLYGIEPNDHATFVAISAILLGIAALAYYVPARKATMVDPMVVLRTE